MKKIILAVLVAQSCLVNATEVIYAPSDAAATASRVSIDKKS